MDIHIFKIVLNMYRWVIEKYAYLCVYMYHYTGL